MKIQQRLGAAEDLVAPGRIGFAKPLSVRRMACPEPRKPPALQSLRLVQSAGGRRTDT